MFCRNKVNLLFKKKIIIIIIVIIIIIIICIGIVSVFGLI